MSKKIVQAFAEQYNFVLVVGQKESETMSVTVQGRSMALVDKVTDKPEKYSKSMQVDLRAYQTIWSTQRYSRSCVMIQILI
ncbi:Threonyl-tRNA_synthetase [Hexamita inflata]|uniref:Threonyl-tRNA synthetase n=1 Tax=Hexamita inflata TaxID=28002 RepID=A0AA86PJ22_9EUKA|nr:Threonyl-tRNA synthetase [Hexamita inflata]